MRRENLDGYWAAIRHWPTLTLADLETLLPRSHMPEVVNGKIVPPKRGAFFDWIRVNKPQAPLPEDPSAPTFLKLIERLERDDPDFIPEHIDSVFSHDALEYVLALHAADERPDLKAKFLQKVDINDLIAETIWHEDKFLKKKQDYPLDFILRNRSDALGTAYIMRRAPLKAGYYADDETMRPFLEIARDYCSNSRLTEAINTQMPLPESLVALHQDGIKEMSAFLCKDFDMARWLHNKRDGYADLSKDEKLEFGQQYLNLLAKSYGIHPPPSLEVRHTCETLAESTLWDKEDREACFAHPLGRITFKTLPDSCEDFLESLSHEFIHGLENCSLLSINSAFKAWHEKNSDVVSLGHETIQTHLRSAALPLSFNVASGAKDALADGRRYGAYYSSSVVGPREDEKEEAAIARMEKYRSQLRERHAYGFEGFISNHFQQTLAMIETSRDPQRVFTIAQNAMHDAKVYIEDEFMPSIPADMQEQFAGPLAEIYDHFDKAHARDATQRERIQKMGFAFLELRSAVIEGHKCGFIDWSDPKRKLVFDQAGGIFNLAVQANNYFKFEEQKKVQRTLEAHSAAIM